MFNKVKSIFGKNSKRLKSVLTSFLLGVGCTGTSLANPKSVSLSTEKRTANSENLVNTYDVMQIVNMVNNNKKEVGGTLALIIASIFGYKKVAPKVSDYMVRRALDKIQDVNGVSDEVLNIANNIIEKYLKIAKRKKIVNDAIKGKQKVFNEASEKGVNFNDKESEGYKKFIFSAQLVNKTKEQALSKLQLSADEWFTKLGGTQKDIDGYKKPDLSKINKNTENQIQKDVTRSDIWPKCTNYNQKIALLGEILKKFEVEEFQGYMQGYNSIASVVIRKFTENDKEMGEGAQFSKEKKAKIYYVYKTIVQTAVNYSAKSWEQKLVRLYKRMLLSFCKRNNVNEIDKSVFLSGDFASFAGLAVRAIYSCHLKPESQIFLWDSIISEVKDGNFDPNLAVEKIFDVWFARALVSHKDFHNDTDLKYLGAYGLDQFMGKNPI